MEVVREWIDEVALLTGPGPFQVLISDSGPLLKHEGVSLSTWLKRPGNDWTLLPEELKKMFHVEHLDAIATDIQYEGHIERQKKQAEKITRMESKIIPADIDYERVHALKKEAVIKLGSIRPATIGQASRIPGITPADIALLLVHLQKRGRQQA